MLHIQILKKTIQVYEELSENINYQELELSKEYQEVLAIANRIKTYRFKIAILGEYSTGKSTLLNALIGEEVIPVGFLPTTKQLVKVQHSDIEYVRSKQKPEEKLTLSRENVRKLINSSSEEVEIAKNIPERIRSFIFYDTPGVNDVNELSEKMIFELLPSADVVIFVLDSTQALKKTEMDFLSNIVQRKDIEKFFFILNKSDLVQDETESIREFVITTLSSRLSIERKYLEDKVIPYSAKKSLEAIEKGEFDKLLFTGHKLLIEKVHDFVMNNRVELLEERVKEELLRIVSKSLTKINVAIDRFEGKDKKYEEQLRSLENQINRFKSQIEIEIHTFESDFSKEINDFKRRIEKSFLKIKKTVNEKIDESDPERLFRSRYIDTLIKSLIEIELNKNIKELVKNLSNLIRDFDDKTFEELKNVYKSSNMFEIPKTEDGNRYDGLFKAAGIISVPVVAAKLLPSMLGGSLLATLLGAAATLGMAMNPKTTVEVGKAAGEFAIKTGELTAQFMHWISRQMSFAGEHIGNRLKKEEYRRRVLKYLEDDKNDILERIDKIDPDEFIDKYIQTKFHKKLELERRKEILEAEKNKELSVTEKNLRTLRKMKKSLEGIINGI